MSLIVTDPRQGRQGHTPMKKVRVHGELHQELEVASGSSGSSSISLRLCEGCTDARQWTAAEQTCACHRADEECHEDVLPQMPPLVQTGDDLGCSTLLILSHDLSPRDNGSLEPQFLRKRYPRRRRSVARKTLRQTPSDREH